MARLLLLGLFPLLGCPPANKDDTGAVEADTDTDTDTDTDADVGITGFDGTLTLTSTLRGAPLCDADVALTGSAYVGACQGCDFDFNIEGTVSADRGTEDCYLDPTHSYVADDYYGAFVFKHFPEYEVFDAEAEAYVTYTNVALIEYYYYGYYSGYYVSLLAFDGGNSDGVFTQTGMDIAWTVDTTFDTWAGLVDFCGDLAYSEASAAYGGSGVEDDVTCDMSVADVWSITLAEGETVAVTLDTIATETASDLAFYVSDPEGCTFASADDSFDCTFTPVDYQCPSYSIVAGTAGTYTVTVYSYDSCNGEDAAYTIRADGTGAGPGTLALTTDDVTRIGEMMVTASGTMVEAAR